MERGIPSPIIIKHTKEPCRDVRLFYFIFEGVKRLTIILVFIFPYIYAQQTPEVYSVKIGKYKCEPNYYKHVEDASQIQSGKIYRELVLQPDSTFKEVEIPNDTNQISLYMVEWSKVNPSAFIFFPKRIDTIFYEKDGKKIIDEITSRKSYGCDCPVDSIFSDEIDKLINGVITIENKSKKQKLIEYNFVVLYVDGELKQSLHLKEDKIASNTEVLHLIKGNKKVVYFGIFDITFTNDTRKTYNIYEGYSWRILYKH